MMSCGMVPTMISERAVDIRKPDGQQARDQREAEPQGSQRPDARHFALQLGENSAEIFVLTEYPRRGDRRSFRITVSCSRKCAAGVISRHGCVVQRGSIEVVNLANENAEE